MRFWAQDQPDQPHENQYRPLSVEKLSFCRALGRIGVV